MSLLTTKSEKDTTSNASGTQTKDPWASQVPYLQDAFSRAQAASNSATSNTPVYQTGAAFNPNQLGTFQSMYDYANNNTVPQQTAANGGQLIQSGLQAAGQNNMSPENIAFMNSRAANQYVAGQDIAGQTAATMRDATRAVNEQALPSIARDSAVGGNTFSNRRALSEGVVQRGLAEKTADVSSNLRSNAYNTGLGLAESARSGAISNGLNAAAMGLGAQNSSLGQQAGLYSMANAAGAGQQAASQVGLDNAYNAASAGQSTPWDNLMRYMQIVGGQQWGGTTNTVQQSTSKEKVPYNLGDYASMATKTLNFLS